MKGWGEMLLPSTIEMWGEGKVSGTCEKIDFPTLPL